MPRISSLTGVLALVLAGFTHASAPIAAALDERAAPPKACGKGYANSQVSACPTNTQFCSSFLRTQPPTTTVTSTITSVTTTISVSTSTVSSLASTRTYNIGVTTCDNDTLQPTKRAELEPRQFGPRCNVNGIDPGKIENACKCLPGFTYRGRRPRATTSIASTTTTFQTSQSVSVTEVPGATHTAARFWLLARSVSGNNANQRIGGFLAQDPDSDRILITSTAELGTNQNFFVDNEDSRWLVGRPGSQTYYYSLYGIANQASGVTPVRINLVGNPLQPPPPNDDGFSYTQISGVLNEAGPCATFNGGLDDGSTPPPPAVFFVCVDDSGVLDLYVSPGLNSRARCTRVKLELASPDRT